MKRRILVFGLSLFSSYLFSQDFKFRTTEVKNTSTNYLEVENVNWSLTGNVLTARFIDKRERSFTYRVYNKVKDLTSIGYSRLSFESDYNGIHHIIVFLNTPYGINVMDTYSDRGVVKTVIYFENSNR